MLAIKTKNNKISKILKETNCKVQAKKNTNNILKQKQRIPMIIMKTLQKRKENEAYLLKIYNIRRIQTPAFIEQDFKFIKTIL